MLLTSAKVAKRGVYTWDTTVSVLNITDEVITPYRFIPPIKT